MNARKNFGEYAKELRILKQLSLRSCCKEADLDPSNWSKIERGLLAPRDKNQLNRFVETLNLVPGSEEYRKFFDLSELAIGEIPADIVDHKLTAKLLPAFFRTVRGEKPSKEEILKLLETLDNA